MKFKNEDDFQLISAISQFAYCERRWGLIYLEEAWEENPYVIHGNTLHKTIHSEKEFFEDNKLVTHSLRLCSYRLGITGQADVVEFNESDYKRKVLPIEYKVGRPKKGICDIAQLCAQAMCLEEMLGVHIDEGFIFYGKTRRRLRVDISEELRDKTETLIFRMHQLFADRIIPVASRGPKCKGCSLTEVCGSEITTSQLSIYFKNLFNKK